MGRRSSESGARSGIGAPIWTPGWPPPSAPPPRNRRCPGRRCTRVGNRLPNPRNYSVEEIARLFGLHKNTVRHWLKQGLATIDDRRPRLVLGSSLSRFLQERRLKGKQPCGPGRIYCVACRAPKAPAGQMAECIPTGPRTGNLRGICPHCDRLIYRRVNLAKIDTVRGELEITFTRPLSRIGESAASSVTWDSNKKAHAHKNPHTPQHHDLTHILHLPS